MKLKDILLVGPHIRVTFSSFWMVVGVVVLFMVFLTTAIYFTITLFTDILYIGFVMLWILVGILLIPAIIGIAILFFACFLKQLGGA